MSGTISQQRRPSFSVGLPPRSNRLGGVTLVAANICNGMLFDVRPPDHCREDQRHGLFSFSILRIWSRSRFRIWFSPFPPLSTPPIDGPLLAVRFLGETIRIPLSEGTRQARKRLLAAVFHLNIWYWTDPIVGPTSSPTLEKVSSSVEIEGQSNPTPIWIITFRVQVRCSSNRVSVPCSSTTSSPLDTTPYTRLCESYLGVVAFLRCVRCTTYGM